MFEERVLGDPSATTLAGCDILLHGVALLCGFGTASLPAQGGQRTRYFNKLRVIFGIGLIGYIGTKGADEPYESYARCHPIHGCAENMAINTAIITTPEAAVKAHAEVKRKRSVAKALAKDGDITGARFELAEAADLDRAAAAILDPSNVLLNPLVAGRGGELVVPTKENMMDRPGLVDTANSDPDMLTAAASVARLDLVADAGALSVGVDAADTIQASNSLEKMLAHQMGVAHTMAMKFAADAQDELFGYKSFGQRHPHRSIEAARMANVAARLMEAYQRAALTLLRMRNGGRQVVTVQHVNISGGQAIVAGGVSATGGAFAGGDHDSAQ